MVLGCWSSRRPRKPWKPVIVRSPSPDCRCSCHFGVRSIPKTHERSSMTALETSNALPRQNYTNNFNESRTNRMLDAYSQVNPSHTYGPVDGSLYATVAKSGGKKSPVTFALPNGAAVADNGSDEGRHTISIDSGISSTVSAQHNHSRNHYAHHRHNGHEHISGTSSGFPSPMNVEVEVHDHNPRHHSKPTSEELAELDELLNGMLQQIESFPDFASAAPKSPIPVAKSQSSPVIPRYTVPKATPPGSVSSRNSDYSYPRFIMSNGSQEHHQTRYLTRPLYNSSSDDRKHYQTGSQPFSYGVPENSPALQRRRVFSESTAYVKESSPKQEDNDDVFSDYASSTYQDIFGEDGTPLTWLQRQQLKLRSKREGKGMQERQMKERQLLAELKSVTKRIPSESSSRESSPPYSQPLHINTTPMNGSSSLRAKPYTQTNSTPSTPSVPVRSTSRTVDTRSLDWDSNRRLQRQRSDSSYDRERPFVAVKRAHEELRENMMSTGKTPQQIMTSSSKYGTVYPYGHHHVYMPDARDEPRSRVASRNGLLMQSSAFDEVDAERPQHSTPSYDRNTNIEPNSWSPSYINASPAVSPTRSYDRPTTPGFPTTPGTPYVNTLSGSSPTYGRSTQSALPAHKSRDAFGDRVSGQSSPGGSIYVNQSQRSSLLSLNDSEVITQHPFSVRDTSSYWYKPNISREEAINMLRNRPAGTFVVRDSNSFPGAFGLALKVATLPPNVHSKTGDISNELVRHFLIEPTSKGVRLKGCPNEPTFSSLSALVYQHSITAIALPCKLIVPECDPSGDVTNIAVINSLSDDSPGSILSQGAACNVLYLVTVDMESLTGPQAVRKAINELMAMKPQPVPTVVHFKVSTKGITLTDNNHRLFFRRHYQLNLVSFCGIDPDCRKWNHKLDNKSTISCLLFGFVARKTGSKTDNQCHIFSEYDSEQPASAIVNFVNKVMAANPSQQHSRSNFL